MVIISFLSIASKSLAHLILNRLNAYVKSSGCILEKLVASEPHKLHNLAYAKNGFNKIKSCLLLCLLTSTRHSMQ